MNRQQVICATDREKADCRGLLLTLKRTTDPGQVLTSLLAVRKGANAPLNETGTRVYINMEQFLETMPVEVESVANPEASPEEITTVEVESTTNPEAEEETTEINLW